MNEENGNEAEKKSILGIFVCIRLLQFTMQWKIFKVAYTLVT